MSWHPTISRDTEYFPNEICGMGAALAGFGVPSAPSAWVAVIAAETAAAALRNSRRSGRQAGQPCRWSVLMGRFLSVGMRRADSRHGMSGKDGRQRQNACVGIASRPRYILHAHPYHSAPGSNIASSKCPTSANWHSCIARSGAAGGVSRDDLARALDVPPETLEYTLEGDGDGGSGRGLKVNGQFVYRATMM